MDWLIDWWGFVVFWFLIKRKAKNGTGNKLIFFSMTLSKPEYIHTHSLSLCVGVCCFFGYNADGFDVAQKKNI